MLNWLKELDPTVLVALIGIFSGLISAGVSRWQTMRQFADEIEKFSIERRHAESDKYLGHAREHTDTVYVPLASALALLKAAFQKYVFEGRVETDKYLFLQQIEHFIAELQRLERQGATAFVTTELEELILSFTSFIRASKSATEPKMEIVYDFNLSFGGAASTMSTSRVIDVSPGGLAAKVRNLSVSIPGIAAEFRTSDLIQAPIDTDEFQARFERDTHRINVLVKEVTLGSAAKSVRI